MATQGEAVVKMRVKETVDGKERMVEKAVGKAVFPIYDTLQEAIECEGDEKCLELVNGLIKTNAMNAKRGLVRGGPSRKLLEARALASLTSDDIAKIAGDGEAIKRLIDERIEQLREEELATAGTVEVAG